MQRNYRLKLTRNYKKKQLIIILVILLFMVSFVTVFGRYVTNSVNNFLLKSKEFYFYSDKLSEKKSVFQVENWSGVDDYTITVNMNSRKNNLETATYDIGYNINYKCSDNAICQLSKQSGIISKEDNSDFFNLTITPNTQLKDGDKVVVEIEAIAIGSYEKTIKGKFTLVVGQEKLTYQITDKVNNPYMDLRITNTLSYYIVETPFRNYAANQKIDIDTYLELTEEEKLNCYSSIVTIEFDPEEVLIDNTNENYQNATNIITKMIDGKNYIKSITLPIDAISSADIRFYKLDSSKNYTYPNSNNKSVVNVTTK